MGHFRADIGCLLKLHFKCDAASTKDDSSKAEKPSALKTQQQQPSTSSDGAGQASTLTIGDAIGQHLQTNRIGNKFREHVRLFLLQICFYFFMNY